MEYRDLDTEGDRLLAATIYLMSVHARRRCPRLAGMVGMHLRLLGRHAELGPHVRDSCQKLAAAWEAIRACDERAQAAPPPPPDGTIH